jgi:hypothetical protein
VKAEILAPFGRRRNRMRKKRAFARGGAAFSGWERKDRGPVPAFLSGMGRPAAEWGEGGKTKGAVPANRPKRPPEAPIC